MKWVGLLLILFTGCGEVSIKITPLKSKPVVRHKTYHHREHKKREVSTPASSRGASPTPAMPLVNPVPPDPRIEDIIRSMEPKP